MLNQSPSLDRENELLARVPADLSSIGNTRLLRALGWAEDEFWEVRNRLVDRGVLEVGKGRGGSVRRVANGTAGAEEQPLDSDSALPFATARESDLYAPLADTLETKWTKDKRVESAILRITAQQGRRSTGGRWTRPDITIATLSTYPYVPGRHFDVITFEVKPVDSIDVTCIYEALAHLRSATRAYVLLEGRDSEAPELDEAILEICAEGKKHGVGVLTFTDPNDYETWEERVEPIRREPEPRKLNDFLATQFNQDQLEKLVRWFR